MTTTNQNLAVSGEERVVTFSKMRFAENVSPMQPSSKPTDFPDGPRITLPETYQYNGGTKSLQKLFDDTNTVALLVLKDGKVRYENYWRTGGRDIQWPSASVAKTFIATLIGIALGEGLIKSLDEPVTNYAPTLKGSGYDGVSIRQALQMSSGVDWNESAGAMRQDIPLDAFVATLVNKVPPGTFNNYSSADTQVLGMVLKGATGSITSYMQQKLCEPLGMQSTSYWMLDSTGMEWAFAGLVLTTRDYAKLGELYRHGGAWNGRQIVPADYVKAATTVTAPHLAPGIATLHGATTPFGYGYQIWIPDGESGDFSAIGAFNQFIYVNPARNVVIVKNSANPRYTLSFDEDDAKNFENVNALQAIAAVFDSTP